VINKRLNPIDLYSIFPYFISSIYIGLLFWDILTQGLLSSIFFNMTLFLVRNCSLMIFYLINLLRVVLVYFKSSIVSQHLLMIGNCCKIMIS
jgi:hypothetical protein